MPNCYQIIDEANWKRALHCKAFRNSAKPTFCMTFEVDITAFRKAVKAEGLSFTMAMVYVVCKCANEIEEFRYRFMDGNAVLYDHIDAAFTFLNPETELFKVVNVPVQEDMRAFCETASKIAHEQDTYFTFPLREDVFQCSAVPFLTYTSFSHTDSGKKDNATPTFDWGKFYEKDGRIKMIMSAQVHHSFVDALHLGRFVTGIQKFFDGFE